MKILIITQYFWPENFRINDLVDRLSEKNHDITIITGIPNYPNGKFFDGYNFFSFGKTQFNQNKLIRFPLIPRFKGKWWQLLLNYFSFAFFSSFSPFFISKEKYDIIFVYEPSPITVGIPAIIIKKVKKIPIVFWVQDLWPESIEAVGITNSKKVISLVKQLVKFIYKHCDLILVQSKGFIESVDEKNMKNNPIKYIPNWAEKFYIPKVKTAEIKKEIDTVDFIIMFAGNIGSAQSIDTIIDSAKILKNERIKWVIIGNGRKKSIFEKKVFELGLESQFKFLDQKPASEMPYYFAHADVLLVTLLSKKIFSYTIPGKIQSYLACGKPILAALNGEGAKVILESKSGIVVDAEDSQELSRAAIKMKNMSSSELDELGINGLNFYSKNFERNLIIDKIDLLLKEQINK